MLTQYEALPPGLLDLPAARLGEVLPGPTLIHLPGRRTPPLFVSVLLHGNEDTGWLAAQSVLKKFATAELPRALTLFIGNVEAARTGLRRLDGQPDYNRVWAGGEGAPPAEAAMVQGGGEGGRGGGKAESRARPTVSSMPPRSWKPVCICPNSPRTRCRRTMSTCSTRWTPSRSRSS